ncbi:hypothetical protein RKD26_006443 [Streptomyces calvus]
MPQHPHTARRGTRRLAGLTAAVAAVVSLTTLSGPGAHAADNPYERGPAPTESSIEATRGPYAVSELSVSSLAVSGFGGGTIYYPTSTADGTFGAVAISPGYTAYQSSIAWLGPRLASQGFVVFTIDTNSTLDQPASRGNQLLAALDYLTQRSAVRGRIDSSRLGVMGHSMGGGGTLEAAKDRPSLQGRRPPDALEPRQELARGPHAHPDLRGRRRLDRPGLQPRRAPVLGPAVLPGPRLPGTERRHPLHAELVEHDDREVQHLLAQAVHRQRHPLRAVPLPAAQAEPDDRGVPGQLPAHLLRNRQPRSTTTRWRSACTTRAATGLVRAHRGGPAPAGGGTLRCCASVREPLVNGRLSFPEEADPRLPPYLTPE